MGSYTCEKTEKKFEGDSVRLVIAERYDIDLTNRTVVVLIENSTEEYPRDETLRILHPEYIFSFMLEPIDEESLGT